MKITFILPSIGKKKGKKYVRNWKREPLTFAVLNKLTPPRFEREFFDDRVELINYETETDIVALSVETYTAKRAYEIAKRFKENGKLIIMGGYHPTSCPEEVINFADIIVVGNAEGVWEEILLNIENNNYKNKYIGQPKIDYGIPDRSIYQDKLKKYMNIGQVEVGRGCIHNCQFCSINSYYKSQYIHRKIEDIVAEIISTKYKTYYLVDDSIFSDREFAKQLFEALIPLKISWASQVTLDIARDEEVLKLMSKSGCKFVLIGFESLNSGNLKQMDKSWNEKIGERDELIKAIHRNKIGIYASFIFGFDNDNREILLETVEFCKKHGFLLALINHLLVLPGTKTYDNFKRDNLLLSEKWWLDDNYTFGTSTFTPKQMSAEELKEMCQYGNSQFFKFNSIFSRWFRLLKRDRTLKAHLLFWYINIVFHFAISRRINIPIGKNLDELPK